MEKAWGHLQREGLTNKKSWKTLWKTALVQLPRAVPMEALYITNPNGPQPFKLDLPSRQPGRNITLYVFIPPVRFPPPGSDSVEPTPNSFPVVMDYHGGGFYLGSCLEQAPFCAKLCRELEAIVIGVDYRLAPFDKFPAPLEDAEDVVMALFQPTYPGYAVLRQAIPDFFRAHWYESLGTREERRKDKVPMPPTPTVHLDTSRIAFSGASSGANIALNMALNVPACLGMPEWPCPVPPDYPSQIPLLLLYPSLDLRQLPSERFRREGLKPLKPKEKRIDIDDHLASTYVSRDLAAHPRASPGLLDTSKYLHAQAKILLILSGLDTLWEQSEIWTKKVEAEGRSKDMKTMRYEDRKHGWTQIPEIALSKEERKTRLEVLDECVRFASLSWAGRDPVLVMNLENGSEVEAQGKPNMKHLEDDYTA
ncbi:Uu.00g123020.m01.CDS01 [Anthostomella pinea]|uniref:Uu.00g123020.m01.CDS01 n=1 Tax=Anthostomella pinea TaxID=933095 RepID=A0AAI8VHC3_9PEZI|nr:Uu.00g123020.m01.CDS01 [Anthostomella pinea]